ncbi:MAG TPA: preprotein translocase subunit YajC [Firmicutes bacterium]|nr:preprotein translocase subunit YajC [Bacillales bacterium]HJA40160.1 preprotein translocase subunit YajC [Bacillota bacterium]
MEGQGAVFMQFLIPIAMIAIFYFLLIRPQQKRQKETMLMQSELQRGDKIVTIGGLHGVIDSVDDENDIVTIKVASGAHMAFDRSAIRNVEQKANSGSN